jgi:ubiquitin carboxyl-terminal hydrolase 34
MLNDGPLRLITQGQEISCEVDEKAMIDFGFKDLQLVFVSQGAASRSGGMSSHRHEMLPPFPGKEKMPMNLLLLPIHFEQLFSLMQNLSDMRFPNDNGVLLPHPKVRSEMR